MRTTIVLLIVASLTLLLSACGSGSDSGGGDELDRMVAEACDRLHTAWENGNHQAVENIMPDLQRSAAEQGYSERKVGEAFDAQCDMPG